VSVEFPDESRAAPFERYLKPGSDGRSPNGTLRRIAARLGDFTLAVAEMHFAQRLYRHTVKDSLSFESRTVLRHSTNQVEAADWSRITTASVPIARAADHYSRRNIIAVALTFWSIMTMLSGYVATFLQLAAARVGLGISEAAAAPPAASIVSDLFPRERRTARWPCSRSQRQSARWSR
jgi:hypothetical protein